MIVNLLVSSKTSKKINVGMGGRMNPILNLSRVYELYPGVAK